MTSIEPISNAPCIHRWPLST